MRDRLSRLIFNKLSETCRECSSLECTEELTDYLLENGVIVPPCKVGDTVYFVARNSERPIGQILPVEIVMIGKTESGFCAQGKIEGNTFDIMHPFEIDNSTFFTSKEEAEEALKGGAE